MENFGSVLMMEAPTSSFPDVEFVVELPRERGWSRFPFVGAVVPIRLTEEFYFLPWDIRDKKTFRKIELILFKGDRRSLGYVGLYKR